jgi:hypothetical protein
MGCGPGPVVSTPPPARSPFLAAPLETAPAAWLSSSRHGAVRAINEKNVEIRALRSITDFIVDTSI